jgi:hypothetical protein
VFQRPENIQPRSGNNTPNPAADAPMNSLSAEIL